MEAFFKPASVAVIGASPTVGKLSYIIMESMLSSGYEGEIYPVNPRYNEIQGYKCYPDIASIGKKVDLAVFAVPASAIAELLREAAPFISAAIIVSGGFSETGEAGRKAEQELCAIAEKEGVRVIGPNCIGIFDAVSNVDTFFIARERVKRPRRGRIALLSQSGSFALTAMDVFASEGIGVTRVVSYGNKMDVNEADCLDYLAEDDETRAVVIYIEGINDGRRFVEAAKRCAAKKTVMALKVGREGAGKKAAGSHTGAVAGRYEIYRAAFKEAGIIELSGYEDILDGCRALNKLGPVSGKRIMILTDGGGMGVGIADASSASGFDVSELAKAKVAELKEIFPDYFAVANPMDLTGSVTDEWFAKALDVALSGDDYDIAIVASLWGPPHLTDNLPTLIGAVALKHKKPVIICSPGGEYAREKNVLFEEAGLPVYYTPEGAVRAARIVAGLPLKR
ncbi:Acetyl-CoA synthetase (ADP-forming) alpha and beta chains, putative [hydrothermal vent metagenome]|uniref:Acetyl-CoA synthetase (ADP-forming) alpha and beta chains, putative n=1 Tax=hydrothermal vent metagenome TaxID=652676 RepID=A0A3B0QWX0_9ZZZZ